MKRYLVLLLLAACMVFGGTSVQAAQDSSFEQKTPPGESLSMKRVEISFIELVRHLKQDRPVTHRLLIKAGFSDLQQKTFSNTVSYADTNIVLKDETVIEKIELQEFEDDSFLTLMISKSFVIKENLEAELGAFELFAAPRSDSEPTTYVNESIDGFTVKAGFAQDTGELMGFSIMSVYKKR
jgi:hypothetical protein